MQRHAATQAAVCAAFLFVSASLTRGDDDLSGRYFIADAVSAGTGISYGGTVDVTPKRSGAYSVIWKLDTGRRLRGLGIRDGKDVLGVSINTGGTAYGLAIYRRENGGRWVGKWITSIDGGGSPGEMSFDGGAGKGSDPLAGRHHFTGRRGGYGSFDGSVTITPRADGYALNFATDGGVALYRGIGTLCAERLVVAWSFGGTPALAAYQVDAKKGLAGRRLTLSRARDPNAVLGTERLARGQPDDEVFPPQLPASVALPGSEELPAPSGGGADQAASGQLTAGPTPTVRSFGYAELMRRYVGGGQADRFLNEQLNAEERALLETAVRRRSASHALGKLTVSQLIEEQRRRGRR